MIDEYLANNDIEICKNFSDVSLQIKNAFQQFFGVESFVKGTDTEFLIEFDDNPLTVNVTLPESMQDIQYSVVYCGLIRGALEAVNMRVKCEFVRDVLKEERQQNVKDYGIKVTLLELIKKKLKDYDD